MSTLARFALNQITTPTWSLAETIEACARHGVGGLGVWRDKVEAYGVDRAARHLREAGRFAACLCTGAWLDATEPAALRRQMAENAALLEMAATVGAPCLVMVVGGLPVGCKDIGGHRERIADLLCELAPTARALGVRLGIEPLHPMYAAERCCISTLEQANDLCERIGDAAAIVADVYHCWWDPHFERELRRAGPSRIVTFHYCDWRVPTRNLRDRAMPGDGVIDLARIRGWLDDMGYTGPFELELFSELDWWQRDPEETLKIGIERCTPLVS